MHRTPWKFTLGAALSAGLIAPLMAVPAVAVEVSPAAAGSSPVTINEAYVNGGSTGAAYKNKFIELYNASDAAVSLDGWSLQYRASRRHRGSEHRHPADGHRPRRGLLPAQGRPATELRAWTSPLPTSWPPASTPP